MNVVKRKERERGNCDLYILSINQLSFYYMAFQDQRPSKSACLYNRKAETSGR